MFAIILPLCVFKAPFSLVVSKRNHYSTSKGGLNVTAPKKTTAQISVREMKSFQEKKRGHSEAPVSVEISTNLSPFTLFVRK